MSFAGDVKREMIRSTSRVEGRERRKAQAYGMLLFGRGFGISSVSLQTENAAAAKLYQEYVAEYAGAAAELRESVHSTTSYTVSVDSAGDREKVLAAFGHKPDEIHLRIQLDGLEEESIPFFLSGAYLSCGNMTNPSKSYHMEWVVPRMHLCDDLCQLLRHYGTEPKVVNRRGAWVIYIKESAQIEDMLTLMGAPHCSMDLMNVKIYKEFRNNTNRVVNCETANIQKTIVAASSQMEDIKLVFARKGKDQLPEGLAEIGQMRLDNPEMTLRELGAAMTPPVSRSGANHRLRRISLMAQELREGLEADGKLKG